MREVMALVRASWRAQMSYRVRLLMSLGGLGVTTFTAYFVSKALQPYMARSISEQSPQYFGFLVVGMIALMFVGTAVNSIPDAISSGISNGTLEALLSTRASLPSIVAGLVGYSFLWTTVKAALFVGFAVVLGMHLAWGSWFIALGVLALIVLAYVPLGLLAAAMVLAFRTTGALPQGVMLASGLLGGVYWSTTARVIPTWIRGLSDFVPLTAGLRAVRETLLNGIPISAVMPEIAQTLLFVVVLNAIALLAIAQALLYARRAGTLAQY